MQAYILYIMYDNDFYTNEEHVQQRINHFKSFGYDTLVIWESELKDMDKLIIKLQEFVGE